MLLTENLNYIVIESKFIAFLCLIYSKNSNQTVELHQP